MSRHAFSIRALSSLLSLVLAFGFGGSLAAQDPKEGPEEKGPTPAELAQQIQRNMKKIEEELSKAGTHDPSKGEQVRKDLEELLDTMKNRQNQVVKDIDDIVKQFKSCGGGGSSDSNQNQKASKPRDRNQSQAGKQPKPRDPNEKQGGKPKPKDGKQQKKKGGGAENNTEKETNPGDNVPGDPREEAKGEKLPKINLNEIWGNLPSELRQKLVDRNYDEFTPEYKEQIAEYFKKTGGAQKN